MPITCNIMVDASDVYNPPKNPKIIDCPIGSWCENLSPHYDEYHKYPKLLIRICGEKVYLLCLKQYQFYIIELHNISKFLQSYKSHKHYYLVDKPCKEYRDKFFNLLKKRVHPLHPPNPSLVDFL